MLPHTNGIINIKVCIWLCGILKIPSILSIRQLHENFIIYRCKPIIKKNHKNNTIWAAENTIYLYIPIGLLVNYININIKLSRSVCGSHFQYEQTRNKKYDHHSQLFDVGYVFVVCT